MTTQISVQLPSVRRGVPAATWNRGKGERDFLYLQDGYRPFGGLTTLRRILEETFPYAPAGAIAVVRQVQRSQCIAFWEGDCLWLPVFQFGQRPWQILPGVRTSLELLTKTFDALEVAQWYCTPNALLAGRVPASFALSPGDALYQAARADRFLANGD